MTLSVVNGMLASVPASPTVTGPSSAHSQAPAAPKLQQQTSKRSDSGDPEAKVDVQVSNVDGGVVDIDPAIQQARRLTLQDPATKPNSSSISTSSSLAGSTTRNGNNSKTRTSTSTTTANTSSPFPISGASASPRPLLSRQLQFKSSSAIPTLTSTPVVTSGSTTPTRRYTGLYTKSVPSSRRASMAGGDVHTAADLLRQAMMHGSTKTANADDDSNDQIGSNSSTPPGAATPRPDLIDKRLPGLVNSYFGQNTPPQTPRTSSHDGRAAPTSSIPTSTAPTTPSKLGRVSSNAAPTVGPVIGKLTVEISQGRGLRPSTNPYCVCQFQWAEYISSGPTKSETSRTSHDGLLDRPRLGSIPMQRTQSDKSGPRAIPMSSRQSSQSGRDGRTGSDLVADPKWEHKAVFDVTGEHAELDVAVYDRANQEAFLGHVRLCPALVENEAPYECWLPLEPREGQEEGAITGEIHLKINFQKTEKRHYGPEDFQILKLIGKGTFGQVFQVRKKDTGQIYAMKVLSKKVIVQKKEVAHTLGERNILVRTAMTDSPFIVGLKFSFQTPTDLYLVTDYMSGGELFWHLQKEGRFQEARAKFYIAELILALQHLHEHDIVYRDLKPENILLDANGHIALCDFGLSKANLADSDTTNTFCGTTEYLAPEVLLDEHGYTKMVDFWSLGVLVFEMCCGWSPFYAEDTQQMYKNIAFGKVRFPRDALSTEGRNFVKGLLNRNPKHRLGAQGDAEELKRHPFFEDIDWDALGKKNVVPPFKPKLKSKLDVSNFDPEFTNALNNGAGSLNARAQALASGVNPASTPLSPTVQANFKGFTFVDESAMDRQFGDRDDIEGGEGEGELMEEDDNDDDDEWEKVEKGNRMSGVVPTSPGEESMFQGQGFDV